MRVNIFFELILIQKSLYTSISSRVSTHMPPKHIWGPPTWTFLHTLVEKIHDNDFPRLSAQLFYFIRKVCISLPCPECSGHATRFFSNAPKHTWSSKQGMKTALFMLHNIVNRRARKEIQPLSVIDQYASKDLSRCYNHFISVFHTKGNMSLLADSFQRQMLITDLRRWLLRNRKAFTS